MIEGVSDGGGGGLDSIDMVTTVVVDSRAEIKCSVAVVGP